MPPSELEERCASLEDEILELKRRLAGTTLLQANEAERDRLQRILDTAPVGAALVTDGIVRFANARATELTGLRTGDAAIDVYVNPEVRDRLLHALQREGILREFEVQMYGPNREVRDILA